MNIAILSRGPGNYSTKRLKQVAIERGHTVRVINHAECYVTVEKSRPVVRYRGEDLTDIDAIIPRIGQSVTKYGTAMVRQFEMQGVYTTASSIAINRSRDKLRSMQILGRADVGIPKTVFARETSDVDDVVAQAGGAPLIIKVARGTHGNGVVLAETKKSCPSGNASFLC
jgi:ribosomal protein S6--L-glutamate ligase